MAITPGLYAGLASREGQRQALWDEWIALTGAANDFTRQQIGFIFDGLGLAVGGYIAEDAAAFAKLRDFDEEVYDACLALMRCYREWVAVYDARPPGTDDNAQGILTGIHAVLTARLRQFEDTGTPGVNLPARPGNPVTEEKRAIFESGITYAAKHMALDAGRFSVTLSPVEPPDAAFSHVLESVKAFCFTSAYAYYRDGLRFCLAGLNDLHKREAARYYTDLMTDEREILRQLIEIQVGALDAPDGQSEDVGRLTGLLKAGYEAFEPAAARLRALLTDPGPGGETCRAMEDFTRSVTDAIVAVYGGAGGQLAYVLAERQAAFLAALDSEADALHDQMRLMFFKAAYDFQRLFSQELMLADEITALFAGALQGLDAALAAGAAGEILTGVRETVEIKIESLRESTDAFNEAGARMARDFKAGRKEPTPEEKQAASAALQEAWCEAMRQVPRPHVSEFFADCVSGEAFTALYGYEKRIAECGAAADKALLTFKKETLLYEICTYEEVLTHSVSRLEGTGVAAMDEAAALLHDTFSALKRLLRKNNIEVIRPAAHEPFNAREHEVLMAESREGFAKGEIIQPVTSGYKQNDQVILRANVIAAR